MQIALNKPYGHNSVIVSKGGGNLKEIINQLFSVENYQNKLLEILEFDEISKTAVVKIFSSDLKNRNYACVTGLDLQNENARWIADIQCKTVTEANKIYRDYTENYQKEVDKKLEKFDTKKDSQPVIDDYKEYGLAR